MARVTVPPGTRHGDGFVLEGEALRHAVRVLRVGLRERFVVVDGSGMEYVCVADSIEARCLRARIVEARALAAEAAVAVHLFCASLKGDKLDLVLQKCTELGVASISVISTERVTVRLAARDTESRRRRWQRIAEAAAAQCGRAGAPPVDGPFELPEALARAAACETALLAWEGDGQTELPRLSQVFAGGVPASVAVVIGPEGGFSAAEAALATRAGLRCVTLGPRVLRAETAAIVVPALILSRAGELG